MEIRDATPEDAEALEGLAPGEVDGTRLVLDRRVVVAETEGEVVGFLSYDTWSDAVHVTTMGGEPAVLDSLLEEPRRFAAAERLPLEIVVLESESGLRDAIEAAGFEPVGGGPMFSGAASVRYRDER